MHREPDGLAGYRVARIAVAPEPLLNGEQYDYADSFEVRLDHPDAHTAEEWARTCLEKSAPAVRGLVRFVHGRVARFALSSDPDSVLGWQTVSSTPEALHLRTEGPMLRAEIVARRRSDQTSGFSTFLFYKRPATRLLWIGVGPLHRAVAPYLLRRAAAALTSRQSVPQP
jgi:hypothetical protein